MSELPDDGGRDVAGRETDALVSVLRDIHAGARGASVMSRACDIFACCCVVDLIDSADVDCEVPLGANLGVKGQSQSPAGKRSGVARVAQQPSSLVGANYDRRDGNVALSSSSIGAVHTPNSIDRGAFCALCSACGRVCVGIRFGSHFASACASLGLLFAPVAGAFLTNDVILPSDRSLGAPDRHVRSLSGWVKRTSEGFPTQIQSVGGRSCWFVLLMSPLLRLLARCSWIIGVVRGAMLAMLRSSLSIAFIVALPEYFG
jgi:hypothetical protein